MKCPGKYRERLHKKITSYFLTCNPNNKVCITSRDRGFYPQNEIEVFQILPLNTEEIEKISEQYDTSSLF